MPAPHHPCGGLPVTGISVSLWYCHHHQAWFASSSRYVEQDDAGPARTGGSEREFGPFDGDEDVVMWAQMELAELALSRRPGAPPATLGDL